MNRQPLDIRVSDTASQYPGSSCLMVVYFLKVESDRTGITASNIDNNLASGVVYGDPIESFHSMFSKAYSRIINTALEGTQEEVDKKSLDLILSTIERKSQTVCASVVATAKAIRLEPPESLHNITLESASIMQAKYDDSVVNSFANQLQQWGNQIQNLLSLTEQVRQEDEDSGPRAEMDYWRERLSVFSSLVDSVKSQHVKIVVSVLKIRRHPSITLWNTLDTKITESSNEAKDNVKFLSSLEKYTELLYALDPHECGELVPGLITSVSMVHNISRYYRSPNRICTLLKKVTNQMINTCSRYIRKGGELYEQDRKTLIKKFEECRSLNQKYQSIYDSTLKTKVHSQSGDNSTTQTSDSERELRTHFIIFGKFDAFSSRLESLVKLFTTIDEFVSLSQCRIEGIAAIVKRFTEDIDFTKRSTYNMLDPRLTTFDDEYGVFQGNCAKLDSQIRQIIVDSFSVTETAFTALQLHERLKLTMTRAEGKSELDKCFAKTLQRYNEDLEAVGNPTNGWFKLYNENPPIPKNLPPIAGRIAWARQLMSRITAPMEIFKQYECVVNNEKNKKMIATYNKTLFALATYEKKCYDQFTEAASQLKKEMQNTLIKMDSNRILSVNFSHDVLRIFQEISVFKRFKFELPQGFESFLAQESHLKACRTELQNLLVRHDTILYQITETFPDLFNSAKIALEQVLQPGGQTLTWSSLNISKFIETLGQKNFED